MKRRNRSPVTRVRRCVQLAVLALFVGLLLATRPVPGAAPSAWFGLFAYLDPLILATTALAAHAVPALLLLAFVTVAVTIVLGRVFCGWFCPLGTVHALTSRIADAFSNKPRRDTWSRWQLGKYVILAAVLVMCVFGVQWLTLLDPFAILYRTTTTALWPAAQQAVEEGAYAVYQADPHVGSWHLTSWTEPPYQLLRDHVFVVPAQAFLGGGLILAFFLITVALNFVRRRFWCRYLCPLGGLLGVLSWRPWLRRKVEASTCNGCNLCGMTCHGAAATHPATGWKPQECFGCMNCTPSCPTKGIGFELVKPWSRRDGEEPLDLSRRHVLASGAAGIAGVVLLGSAPQARGRTYNPDLIRPPGSLAESDFLARCIGCGACMKICPTGGLQPAALEAGLAGLWTPRLVMALGYCDHECNRCGQVCPTHAIAALPLAEKKQTRIGLAAFDFNRCIPYAYGRNCMVCEEHCPVPDKAIYFRPAEVTDRNGNTQTIQQPRVDAARCTGCGICQNVCPFKDRPAIRVTSANESRHPENQPILASPDYGAYG
ncbi:MAG TPA: 4Fe-4S binding protein [Phycisphaerae bacterium]|nr:4Fe-4S binding protein [Phycisphaerae bacterium]